MTIQTQNQVERENKSGLVGKVVRGIGRTIQIGLQIGLIGSIIVLPIWGMRSCKAHYREMEKKYPNDTYIKSGKYPFDQLFRDYQGWQITRTNKEGKILVEKYSFADLNANKVDKGKIDNLPEDLEGKFKNLSLRPREIQIFKDLKEGEGPYIRWIKWRESYNGRYAYNDCEAGGVRVYREVHMPEDASISPGAGSTGGKNPIYFQMKDIK